MKQKFSILVMCLCAVVASSQAEDEKKKPMEMKPHKGSAELERIKSLAGKWRGSMGGMKLEVEYTVVAGGSAVLERTFPGTEMEMVTMYNDDKAGKLVMTHYCMLKNRPHLKLKASDEKSISMELDPDGEVDADKEMHMHAVVFTFVSDDEIEQMWTTYANGKAEEPKPMTFKRVKKKAKKAKAKKEEAK